MNKGKETGVIKYTSTWIKAEPLEINRIQELNEWRDKLYALNFIGENEDAIGYGNISIRSTKNEFIVSGSGTGKLKKLGVEHYTTVVNYDLENNSLEAKGPILASSESLTHAVLYELDESINAILHIHDATLWKKLLHRVPTTNSEVEYGTPQMAIEMVRLFAETDLRTIKILAMEGHTDGIIAFGKNLQEAGNLLLNAIHQR